MARLPPLWSQLGSYPASVDRRLIGALWPAGGVDGMAPTVQVATMNISIAAGTAVVPDSRIAMAAYLCPSDASELVALPAAPPAGQDRIDLVVVRPRDAAYGGADTDWIFDLVAGTPAANPSVPSVPAGTLALAQQRVIGGAAFITAANLVDRRPVIQMAVPGAWHAAPAPAAGRRTSVQSGRTTVTTDANAMATIAFPAAFAAVPTVVAAPGGTGGGFGQVSITAAQTATSFQVHCRTFTGAAMGNAILPIHWVAVGEL